MLLYRTLRHLLPTGRALSITIDKTLRKLFVGLAPTFENARTYIDLIWLDLFPEHTRELTAWEGQFGLKRGTLTEQERRDRLAGLWAAQGGQSPSYLQATLRAAGFDCYVHEWWEVPAADPPVARDPTAFIPSVADSYMLVNKLYTAETVDMTGCGEALMECGEPLAECGENDGFVFTRRTYAVPTDPNDWPYVTYIGGETFPDPAFISENRIDEFEDLILKIYPQYLWIGLLVNYGLFLIDDETDEPLIDDDTDEFLFVEG